MREKKEMREREREGKKYKKMKKIEVWSPNAAWSTDVGQR